MSNIISLDDPAGGLPAHLAGKYDANANAALTSGVGQGYPVLSIKGKVWHVVEGGNRELVTNEDGDPKSSLDVVLLKANPHLSKIYYASGYEEGSTAPPDCWSSDGVAPAIGVTSPQATKCAICPRGQWGSRISETGAKGKECSDSRRLAVAPSEDMSRAYLLRVPAASLKDLAIYGASLDKRRAPYHGVVTRIGFDHTVAHQKLTFKALRWLTEAEFKAMGELVDGDVVSAIVGDSEGPAAPADDIAGEPPASIAAAAPAPAKAEPKAAPEPEPEPATTAAAAEPAAAKADKSAALLAEVDATLDDVLARAFDD